MTQAEAHAPGLRVRLRRAVAKVLLAAIYGFAAWLSRRLKPRGPRTFPRSGCAVAINTFHNPNWFRSHIRPLTQCGLGEIILVCDEFVEPMDRVTFECPPRWMAFLLSRAGAKFAWTLRCGVRYRPDLFIGYHIFPCAIIALVTARLLRRPACYQVTSGPLELEGGGWHAENRVLSALQWPSPFIARLAAGVVREFDSVVVRGRDAESFVRRLGYEGPVAVITGSVQSTPAMRRFDERTIDLAFVGRLAEYKRPDRFLAVVAAVAKNRPGITAALIGTGPEAAALQSLARQLGIESSVRFMGQRSDVDELLAQSRVFVLTSRWEGLSIAMLEAMMAGAVPVVANVGDLKDRIEEGGNGFLLAPDDIAGFADRIRQLLDDECAWRRCSSSAVASAVGHSSVGAVAEQWHRHLQAVKATQCMVSMGAVSRASGSKP